MHGVYMIQRTTGMGTLQQGEHLDSMRTIQTDIIATAYASYIVELIDRLIEEGRPEPFALRFYNNHYMQLKRDTTQKQLHCL